MNKLGIIFIILITFISPEMPQEEIYELEDLAAIAKDNKLDTEEWQVILKEKMTHRQVEKHLAALQQEHIVKQTTDEYVTKHIAYSQNEENDLNILYELTIPKNNSTAPELVVIIQGDHLSLSVIESYKATLKSIRNQFFTKKYNLFTCLTTMKNGKIASDDFSKMMSKNLDLKNVSTQSDMIKGVSYQETIYGYTPIWDNEFIIENKPLNIQIVIQELKNEKQKVIIGTPLLITEY